MDIDQWLGRFYAAIVLGTEPADAVQRALSDAMTDDPDLAVAARARWNELGKLNQKSNGSIDQRCFISSVHLRLLNDIFAPSP